MAHDNPMASGSNRACLTSLAVFAAAVAGAYLYGRCHGMEQLGQVMYVGGLGVALVALGMRQSLPARGLDRWGVYDNWRVAGLVMFAVGSVIVLVY